MIDPSTQQIAQAALDSRERDDIRSPQRLPRREQ
jgi:hypothetical protein